MKFRMVDRILAWQPGRRITGLKTISFEEYSLKSAWGSGAALPESLLMESLFQLGNWLVMLSSDFSQMGLIEGAESVRFIEPVGPGDVLELHVETAGCCSENVLFDGRIRTNGRIVADASGCLMKVAPLIEYRSPEDVKTLFSEIHRPFEEVQA